MMFSLPGAGVGGGIAIGNAYVIQRSVVGGVARRISRGQIPEEVAQFDQALKKTSESLESTRSEIPASAPKDIAAFLDAHILMVNDPSLREATVEIMERDCFGAESALTIHRNQLAEVFENVKDEYLRSKKDDVDQVIQQIQHQLLVNQDAEGTNGKESDLSGCILVAHDLTPADTVRFMKMGMSAFVTNLGSRISHVAILAGSLKIPAVVGLHGAVRHIAHGSLIAVDSLNGEVIVNPDAQTLTELKARQYEYHANQLQLQSLRNVPAQTLDGEDITLLANVELPEDIQSAQDCGASGVGLYRTEYLFMNRLHLPSEQEQFEAYAKAVKEHNQVTIRTLDLGADKQVDGGRRQGKVATNPALGIRAVRFCLRSTDMFRTQLRAIYRASAFGSVKCMIPMLSNLDEIDEVHAIINRVKRELNEDNMMYDPTVPIGGMIEVPAAAISADEFAERLDFLSIGTNDLIQYTLAIDRVDDEVNYLYDPLHSSILRLIRNVIVAGNKFGKPVSLCGEMASDPIYTRLLLGLGLKIFSMDSGALPAVKQCIRSSWMSTSVQYVEQIMGLSSSQDRIKLLQQMNQEPAS